MLGFGAKKKRSVENWRRRARWIDLQKTQVIIISPETQSAVDDLNINVPVSCPQKIPSAIDFPTLHQMETCSSGTSVSFKEINPLSPGVWSFEKEIDVRSLGRNAANKWIIRTLKNLPSKTK